VRRKDSEHGRNLVAIDAQGRACLPAAVRAQHHLDHAGQPVHLTLDPVDRVLLFREFADIDTYARNLAKGVTSVREQDIVEFMFFNHVGATVDGRGRVAIPENLRRRARLDDSAYLTATTDYVCLANTEASIERHRRVGDRLRAEFGYTGGPSREASG